MLGEWQLIVAGKQYHGEMLLYNAKAPDHEIDMVAGYQACNSGCHFYGYGSSYKFTPTHYMHLPARPATAGREN